MPCAQNRSAKRKGIGALEVLLILPVMLIVLLAGVQFSTTLTAEDKVAEASRQGARVAATSGDEIAIHSAIRNVLGETVYDKATITIKYINTDDTCVSGVSVEITITIPAKDVTPNYLKFVGFDNKNDTVIGRTVMRMESVQ